jgi:hypothetical protein
VTSDFTVEQNKKVLAGGCMEEEWRSASEDTIVVFFVRGEWGGSSWAWKYSSARALLNYISWAHNLPTIALTR